MEKNIFVCLSYEEKMNIFISGLLFAYPAFLSKTDEDGYLLRMKMVQEQAEDRAEVGSLLQRQGTGELSLHA